MPKKRITNEMKCIALLLHIVRRTYIQYVLWMFFICVRGVVIVCFCRRRRRLFQTNLHRMPTMEKYWIEKYVVAMRLSTGEFVHPNNGDDDDADVGGWWCSEVGQFDDDDNNNNSKIELSDFVCF